MPGFEYYIIYGNEKDGITSKDYEKFGKAVEKHGLKMVFRGSPLRGVRGSSPAIEGPRNGLREALSGQRDLKPLPHHEQQNCFRLCHVSPR